MNLYTYKGQVKNPRSKVYRRLYIKRRRQETGLYESDWQEISDDVIKWGTIRKEVDSTRANQFKFSNITITLNNDKGLYNTDEDENSLWYGFGDQQRTLVKIVTGFVLEELGDDGIWDVHYLDESGIFDYSTFDTSSLYDNESVTFSGYISGDINLVGNNQINIPIVPLTECFRQYSASRLTGYNSSLTASDFIELVRDQQDLSGNYIFRPFFGNTTSSWVISTTTSEYTNLNTSTAESLTNLTVWEVITKLAEAENHVPIVTSGGIFKFVPRSGVTAPVFSFFGGQSYSSEYGNTIKKISYFGKKFTKYYSRVVVRFNELDTTTSYAIADSNYEVTGSSGPWTLGERTLSIENTWIPNLTVAETIANELFDEFSDIKKEIDFTTSFIPHLEIFDRVLITYDSTPVSPQSLWDLYNWGNDTEVINDDDLLWDSSKGDSIKLLNNEFKLIAIDINLDSLECRFLARE